MASHDPRAPRLDPHARLDRLKQVAATAAVAGFGAIAALITVNGLGGTTATNASGNLTTAPVATPRPAFEDDDVSIQGDGFFQPQAAQPQLRIGGNGFNAPGPGLRSSGS